MRTIHLVSCVAAKAAHECAAKDLYLSPLFKLARSYAEQEGNDWYILSAWWGLLDPNAVIGPYELTLNTMKTRQRKAWAEYVIAQLEEIPDIENARLVFIAGARYREHLVPWAGERAEIPLEGLRIGEQLQWLKNHTEK